MIFKTILLLSGVISISADTTYQLDIKKSITRIKAQIQVTKTNPAQWSKLDKIIDEVMECLQTLPPLPEVTTTSPETTTTSPEEPLFKVEDAKWMPPTLTAFIESLTVETIAEGLKSVDWSALEGSKVAQQDYWDRLREFMDTPKFRKIHDTIWSDEEFLDLIAFFYRAGYPEIYGLIKLFYETMGQEELAAALPTGPNSLQSYSFKTRENLPKTSGNRLPLITYSPPSIKQDCSAGGTIGDLLGFILTQVEELNQSNIHEVIKVFLYMLQEVLGNVAMHVLLLKMGEPQKGAFFHEVLSLEEMDEGIVYIQGLVLQDGGIAQLNEVLKQVTGLDLGNVELFKYVVNLIQYLVWNIDFPTSTP